MKLRIFLCLLVVSLVVSEEDAMKNMKAVRGVFESCSGCRLNSMPGVRRFFYDSVLKREYGDQLDVKFVPGAPPELVLYDANGVEISRTAVGRMKFDDMHELVQAHGFTKVAPEEAEAGGESADGGQQEL